MSEPQSNDDVLEEARGLIVAMIEERLEPVRAARLEQLVCENVAVRRLYATYIHMRVTLETVALPVEGWEAAQTAGADSDALHDSDSLHDTMVTRAIHDAAPQEPSSVQRAAPLWQGVQKATQSGDHQTQTHRRLYPWAALVAVSLMGLVALLLMPPRASHVAKIPTPPTPAIAATLSRTIAARWASPNPPAVGSHFSDQTALKLAGGYAEFAFASGADVVVQAPAEITIQSNNSAVLRSGKLTAHVPPPAVGFTVRAGDSTITDLGTEFGISQTAAGTEVDVFKGKISARTPTTRPTLLLANDAARIDARGDLSLNRGGAIPQHFVRQLQTDAGFLDMVDLVCGGDGTTGRRGAAIDARTGKYGRLASFGTSQSAPGFHSVPLTVIDGCFVPNPGLTQVDSAGHYCAFPGANGQTFNNILAGIKTIWPTGTQGKAPLSAVLGGVDYSQPPHDFLFMHANSGLTFDLAAIAALHPANGLAALHCLVGNSARQDINGRPADALASVYVLVDGVVRFQRVGFSNMDAPFAVNVPLRQGDRFLTLVTVQGRPSIGLDWIIFADPRLSVAGPAGEVR